VTHAILITGCSSGIGLSAARRFRKLGWRVFATARKPADLERLKNEEGVEAIYLDYTENDSIASCADAVLSATEGALYALVNNGAYGQPGAVEDLRTDVLRAQFEANVFGWHELTRRLLPAMRKRGDGRIVHVSSVLGLVSAPYRGAYCASKYAIEALADAMRLELTGTGVYVCLIEPGPIESRFVEHALEAYRANIDMENSPHRDIYKSRLAAMERGGKQTFKLGPDAVVDRLFTALESRRPKARYFVTAPTYGAAFMKRFFPTALLDAVMRRD
jgi:NAD(P)-dependent dehydrogenase (short-subunit alcohol dehydrogenase family)